jgi:hypothetical protein
LSAGGERNKRKKNESSSTRKTIFSPLSLSLSYLDARGSLEGEVVEVHRAVASAAVLKLLLWDDGERKKRAIAGGDD